MAWKSYQTEQGEFCIDWDTCCQIMRSHHRAKTQLTHSREVVESQASVWNPMTWKLPDLSFIEVDWPAVARETENKTLMDAMRLGAIATFDKFGIDKLVHTLREMQSETRRHNEEFRKRMRAASAKSHSAMERSISYFEGGADTARLVRDLSGSFLIGAATVATGGGLSAVGLVAGGSGTALKSVARYQDTGSVASATIEAAQNITFVVFPAARGKALVGNEKVAKLVVSVAADTGKALLEGDGVGEAMIKGALNLPIHYGSEAISKSLAPIVRKAALPIATRVVFGGAKKMAEDQTKKHLQRALAPGALEAKRSVSAVAGIARSMTFEDDLLVKLAVIDMSKGIGHSWW